MQRTAPQVEMNEVLQCSSWCRDGNTSTVTYHNADVIMEYEQSLRNMTQLLVPKSP